MALYKTCCPSWYMPLQTTGLHISLGKGEGDDLVASTVKHFEMGEKEEMGDEKEEGLRNGIRKMEAVRE